MKKFSVFVMLASVLSLLAAVPEYLVTGKTPGRLEKISVPGGTSFFVDYAHTDDALKNALAILRKICRGKLTVVFGAGGDRDKSKRPRMGKVAAEMADNIILTSDNPRTEDPMDILASVEAGMKRTDGEYVVIENRREAIKYALQFAKPSDVVVLAGKGHETYQEIKGVRHPFNEKIVVAELLKEIQEG